MQKIDSSLTETPLLGIFGGTFNPIHFGHLRMAQELAEALGLDQVRFIPAAMPPHKPSPAVSAEHRAVMVHLAIANNPLFTLDERELNRAGASYTVDTLQSLRNEVGAEASITLFMGSDAFTKLDTWHRWQEIIELCHIGLVKRPALQSRPEVNELAKVLETFLHHHYTENADDLQSAPAGFITMRDVTVLDISSTVIRQLLHHQASVRYLTPEPVLNYIQAHQLYL